MFILAHREFKAFGIPGGDNESKNYISLKCVWLQALLGCREFKAFDIPGGDNESKNCAGLEWVWFQVAGSQSIRYTRRW